MQLVIVLLVVVMVVMVVVVVVMVMVILVIDPFVNLKQASTSSIMPQAYAIDYAIFVIIDIAIVAAFTTTAFGFACLPSSDVVATISIDIFGFGFGSSFFVIRLVDLCFDKLVSIVSDRGFSF